MSNARARIRAEHVPIHIAASNHTIAPNNTLKSIALALLGGLLVLLILRCLGLRGDELVVDVAHLDDGQLVSLLSVLRGMLGGILVLSAPVVR